jgi:hypothetical protein
LVVADLLQEIKVFLDLTLHLILLRQLVVEGVIEVVQTQTLRLVSLVVLVVVQVVTVVSVLKI